MMKNRFPLILCTFLILLSHTTFGQEDKKVTAKIESRIVEDQIQLKAVVANNTPIYAELNYLLISIKKETEEICLTISKTVNFLSILMK
jgi:hypothetical protein